MAGDDNRGSDHAEGERRVTADAPWQGFAQESEQSLRDAVLRQIDQLTHEIQRQLSELQALSDGSGASGEILADQLALLHAARETAQSGQLSDVAALMAALPALQSAAQTATKQAVAEAAVQMSAYTAEVTEFIREQSIHRMAERLTARDFAQMTDRQLAMVDARVADHIQQSQ